MTELQQAQAAAAAARAEIERELNVLAEARAVIKEYPHAIEYAREKYEIAENCGLLLAAELTALAELSYVLEVSTDA